MAATRPGTFAPPALYLVGIVACAMTALVSKLWAFEGVPDVVAAPFRPEIGAAVAVAFLAPRRHRITVATLSLIVGRVCCAAFVTELTGQQLVADVLGDSVIAALGIAGGISLLRRYAVLTPPLTLAWLGIALVAASVGTIVAVVIGLPDLSLTLFWQRIVAGTLGLYAIGPLSLLAQALRYEPRSPRDLIEVAATGVVLALVTVYAFSTTGPAVYLVLPVLLWLSVRTGTRFGSPASVFVAVCACVATSQGNGPFALGDQIAQTQAFLGVVFVCAAMLVNFEEVAENRRRSLVEQTRRLDESRDRWRRFDQAAQEGIIEVNADSVVTYANERFATMVGRRSKDLVGVHLSQFVGQDRWIEVADQRHKAVAGESIAFEIGLNLGERNRWGLVSVSPLLHDDGSFRGASVLVTDITAIKAAEIERIDLVDELASVERSEQARLARDLHDGPLQDLTAVQVILGHLANERPEEPIVGKAAAAMTDALAALRSGVTALDPVDVASGGLAEALYKHGMRAIGVSEIHVDVQQRGTLPKGSAARVLYRIGREAITNAARHASPTKILITVGTANGVCELTVRDDGIGFKVRPNSLTGHMGLRSMRERARSAGADLDIQSSQDGTVVTVRIAPTR